MDLYDNDMSYDIVGVHVYIALTTLKGELLRTTTHTPSMPSQSWILYDIQISIHLTGIIACLY